MLTNKFIIIFLISIVMFMIHGTEEYLTGFYDVDPFYTILFSGQQITNPYQSGFYMLQLAWWILLIVLFLSLLGKKWQLRLLYLFGFVLFFEAHHLIKAILVLGYYPGSITATILPILGVFYWKELKKIKIAYERS